jgi:MoaA/NifB/PqqE/SkfB family radical SAM enzyme
MDKETIKRVIQDLKGMGVFWIGLTGGEPLLNKNLVEIVESVGDDCAIKLFTTGCTLTKQLAADLKNAGLFYVSVSLDHWKEAEHDRVRRYEGAFRTAVEAVDIFRSLGGIHVSVSAVLSKEMLKRDLVDEFLGFLAGLGIHEAWLSETKPSVADLWGKAPVITEEERSMLVTLQDQYNKKGGMTVNYLGHFEDAEHFGCSAGHKMVYIDAFGEVSPCVFIPMTFGNVKEKSISEIYEEMKGRFPTEESCFINKNYPILQKYYQGQSPIVKEDSVKIMEEVGVEPLPRFFRLHYR